MIKKIRMIGVTILCFSLYITHASAKPNIIGINGFSQPNPITFTPSDIISGTTREVDIDFCVVSRDEGKKNRRPPFNVKLDGPASTGQFYLTNGYDWLNVTAKFSSQYRKGGAGGLTNFDTLTPGQDSQRVFRGAKTCDGTDGNYGKSRLRFSLTPSQALREGEYSGNFTLQVDSSGRNNSKEVSFSLHAVVPSLVQITNLEDITIQDWGDSGYTGSSSFCVYSSKGSFLIKAEGEPSDSGAFLLHQGNLNVPYSVRLRKNNVSPSPLQIVTPGQKVDLEAPYADCNTSNNATVGVSVERTDAESAASGTYSGTLYLTVEPN